MFLLNFHKFKFFFVYFNLLISSTFVRIILQIKAHYRVFSVGPMQNTFKIKTIHRDEELQWMG